MSHLVWGSVLLTAAGGRLFVVFANVHHLPLGALSDQVSAHARNIFEAMTCQSSREKTGELQPGQKKTELNAPCRRPSNLR